MNLLITDRVSYSISKREYLDNGFLKVPGRVARTGIQEYLASELGITDRDPKSIVKVYRPASEVFSPDSIGSYKGTDVTDDHPSEMVDSANFKKYSVGHVDGDAYQDGDFVIAPLIIKDAGAIEKIESGKAELSAGYYAEYVEEKGVTEDGQDYDYKQTEIKINHVALVDRARAGHQARIFDNKKGAVMLKITLDNGNTVSVQDEATATLVQDAFNRQKQAIADMEEKAEETDAELEKAKAKGDMAEEEVEKEKAAKDAALAELAVFKNEAAIKDAKSIAGEGFTTDADSVIEVKRAVLAVLRDSVKWADKSEAYVEAAYDMAKEKAEDEDGEDEDEKKKATDSYTGLAKDMATDQKPKMSAYDAKREADQNAWRKTAGQGE